MQTQPAGSANEFIQSWRARWRYLWALPWSILGLLLAPFFDRRSRASGILLAEGARWPRRLGWRYRAITLGHTILAIDQLDPPTLGHELAHVRQYERWGPFFVPAYALASLAAWSRGRHPYRDNHFELAATCATSPDRI